MIKINLLPYRVARKKEDVRFQVNVFLLSVILALIMVFWYNMHLNSNIKELRQKIKTTNEQVAKYEKINK